MRYGDDYDGGRVVDVRADEVRVQYPDGRCTWVPLQPRTIDIPQPPQTMERPKPRRRGSRK